jgi:hypothetical protein
MHEVAAEARVHRGGERARQGTQRSRAASSLTPVPASTSINREGMRVGARRTSADLSFSHVDSMFTTWANRATHAQHPQRAAGRSTHNRHAQGHTNMFSRRTARTRSGQPLTDAVQPDRVCALQGRLRACDTGKVRPHAHPRPAPPTARMMSSSTAELATRMRVTHVTMSVTTAATTHEWSRARVQASH